MMASRELFVDTSGWAAFIERKDPAHAVFDRVIVNARKRKRGLVTTNYVISELVALLTTRAHTPRPRLIQSIELLKKNPFLRIIHVDQATDAVAWDLLRTRLDKEWSLVDATSFVVMRQLAVTEALTTDHHFDQAGFARLPSGQ